MRRTGLLLGLLAAVGLSGCGGTAVLIARTETGGVLGLEGDHEQAMADARRLMSESCSGAYTIAGERTVVAGTHRGRTISEVQVRYLCGVHPERQAPPP